MHKALGLIPSTARKTRKFPCKAGAAGCEWPILKITGLAHFYRNRSLGSDSGGRARRR
jgi:hypothetical protein